MANYFEWKPSERNADELSTGQPVRPAAPPPEPLVPAAFAPSHEAALPDASDVDANLAEVDDDIRPMVGMVAAMMEPTADVDAVDGREAQSDAGEASVGGLRSLLEEIPDAPGEPVIAPAPLTRLELLTAAIGRYPDAPVNYVLRGEALREAGDAAAAVEDFLIALQLAEGRETTWEFLNRAFLDRARQGLRRCGYTSAD